ncbi:riboflavin transporter MCH5 [Colletotrichum chrysophilum]|uniref:Riboflavin transporter MCH5 n=1 Tax=Colletotrichum chrysophilum TaxID=1836956 RepID=A0AAD9AMV2_9PEZI|nr:riboflavin transporter MCH5 [Colletotrichum chrysophilum]
MVARSVSSHEDNDDPNSVHHPPPDGGLPAYLSVLSGFLVIMNTWGLIISFGVFQTYYVSSLGQSRSDVAWIGSITVFLLFFGGILSGRLTDAGHFRVAVTLGAILLVLGTFMTSLCTEYWQLILAQGVCVGLGNGLLSTPHLTVISTYFNKRLPLALGTVACGSVTGGLIYPSMARVLLPSIGFGWTMRSIGFIQLATLAIALGVVRPRARPVAGTRLLVDWGAFKELEFTLYFIGVFLAYLGVFFPFFFLTSYAREKQGMSYVDALNLLLVLNGIGFIARLFPSLLSAYFGTLNTFIGLVFASSLCIYTWIAVQSLDGLYVWTAFYSMSVGGVQSLFPAAVTSLSPDRSKLGSQMGIISSAVGVRALIGPPISGQLISISGGSYVPAQVFAGSAFAAGCGLMFQAREVRRKKRSGQLLSKL